LGAFSLDPLAMDASEVSPAVVGIPSQLSMLSVADSNPFAVLHEAGSIALSTDSQETVEAFSVATSLGDGFVILAAGVSSTVTLLRH